MKTFLLFETMKVASLNATDLSISFAAIVLLLVLIVKIERQEKRKAI